MVKEIVLWGDPVLREKGKLVTEVTDKIRTLADDMLETMREAQGVGLAAQQVGEALQLAVIDVSHDEECVSYVRLNGEPCELEDIMPLVFVNPKLEMGSSKEVDSEGCLSFPELRIDVRRPLDVTAHLQLLDGEKVVIEADGLLARAIQHEVDHLFGILFIDRLSTARKMSMRRRLKDLKRMYAEEAGWE
ncbi:MAG: peptide deformylase [Verrucomicrobiales bacterium]|nr:peptide deformylase [Verrucomicrobiales bacterium]